MKFSEAALPFPPHTHALHVAYKQMGSAEQAA